MSCCNGRSAWCFLCFSLSLLFFFFLFFWWKRITRSFLALSQRLGRQRWGQAQFERWIRKEVLRINRHGRARIVFLQTWKTEIGDQREREIKEHEWNLCSSNPGSRLDGLKGRVERRDAIARARNIRHCCCEKLPLKRKVLRKRKKKKKEKEKNPATRGGLVTMFEKGLNINHPFWTLTHRLVRQRIFV